MKINNTEEATRYLEEIYKPQYMANRPNISLGNIKIYEESVVKEHKAWHFYIEGMFLSANGMKFWLIDDGSTVCTTISEDENTLEKAYEKKLKDSGTANS